MRVPAFIQMQIPNVETRYVPARPGPISRLIRRMGHHIAVRTTTRELELLDERTLSDIGLSRSDIPHVAHRMRTHRW